MVLVGLIHNKIIATQDFSKFETNINKIETFIPIKIPTSHHRDQVQISLSTDQLDPITEHPSKRVIFSICQEDPNI